MAEVSVIVPTYNRRAMLDRALGSIRAQIYEDYEVIVVNDGGEDVSAVVAQYPKARYISHARNRGLPAARNTAIHAARGRYIAYLDDDDVWYPEHLTACMGRIGRMNRRVVYTDCHFWHNEAEYKLEMSFDFDRKLLRQHNITPIICVMHDRSLFDECGAFDESLPNHEDYDLLLRFAQITDFHHNPVVTCAYSKRNDGSQMTSNQDRLRSGFVFVRDRFWSRPSIENKPAPVTLNIHDSFICTTSKGGN